MLKPRTNIRQFEAIYTSSGLLSYVREIEICGCLMVGLWDQDECSGLRAGTYEPDHTWISNVLPFLTRFQGIQTLQLIDLSWGDVPQEARALLLTHFTSVSRLHIDLVDFWNSNQLLRTLQAFPHLSSLKTERLSFHKASHTRRQISSPSPLSLRTLELRKPDCARYGPLFQWLVGSRASVTVDNAFIHWDDTDVDSLFALIRKIAPTLRNLSYEQCSRVSRMDFEDDATPPDNRWQDGDMPQQYYDAQAAGNDDDAITGDDDHSDIDGGLDLDGMEDYSIDLDDDEVEENSTSEFDAEFKTIIDEDTANRAGILALETDPIRDSALERVAASIHWSPMAPLAVKLLTQLISPRTTLFVIRIMLPFPENWIFMDWPTLDSVLASVSIPKGVCGAVFELQLMVPSPVCPAAPLAARALTQTYLPRVISNKDLKVYVIFERPPTPCTSSV
ncbi:hypothetical protein BKA93DRAFT_759589 [Sparassis latifolia]